LPRAHKVCPGQTKFARGKLCLPRANICRALRLFREVGKSLPGANKVCPGQTKFAPGKLLSRGVPSALRGARGVHNSRRPIGARRQICGLGALIQGWARSIYRCGFVSDCEILARAHFVCPGPTLFARGKLFGQRRQSRQSLPRANKVCPGQTKFAPGEQSWPRANKVGPGQTLLAPGKLCLPRANFVCPGQTLTTLPTLPKVCPGQTLFARGKQSLPRANFFLALHKIRFFKIKISLGAYVHENTWPEIGPCGRWMQFTGGCFCPAFNGLVQLAFTLMAFGNTFVQGIDGV